jgi:hypothetical protein
VSEWFQTGAAVARVISRAPMLALLGVWLVGLGGAQAASAQLLNKTVAISWSESIQEKTEDGRMLNTQASRQRTAYVSSAGRVFVKAATRIGRQEKSAEVTPGRIGRPGISGQHPGRNRRLQRFCPPADGIVRRRVFKLHDIGRVRKIRRPAKMEECRRQAHPGAGFDLGWQHVLFNPGWECFRVIKLCRLRATPVHGSPRWTANAGQLLQPWPQVRWDPRGPGRFRTKHATGLDPVVDPGSREENASRQDSGASVLIQSELKRLWLAGPQQSSAIRPSRSNLSVAATTPSPQRYSTAAPLSDV